MVRRLGGGRGMSRGAGLGRRRLIGLGGASRRSRLRRLSGPGLFRRSGLRRRGLRPALRFSLPSRLSLRLLL
jgi:hypothetical protein